MLSSLFYYIFQKCSIVYQKYINKLKWTCKTKAYTTIKLFLFFLLVKKKETLHEYGLALFGSLKVVINFAFEFFFFNKLKWYINNCDLPRTRRAKGKPHKSIYKLKVQTTQKAPANTNKRTYKWTPIQRSGCFHQLW